MCEAESDFDEEEDQIECSEDDLNEGILDERETEPVQSANLSNADTSELENSSRREIQTFETVESEIGGLMAELNKITYNSNLSISTNVHNTPSTSIVNNIQDDFIYDLNNHQLFTDLELQIGTNTIPRFSCSCHKLNIVTQKSVESQEKLKLVINELSKLAGKIRFSSQLINIFDELKCRPKIENKTRWFSQLYVLLWAQSAYKKNGMF